MTDLLDGYKQQAPFAIQVELTEGCNLGCSFCGLQGMREKGTKPWYFMTKEIAEDISSKIAKASWTAKIIFAMHGEPTLNPDIFDIIKIFRKNLPDNVFHIISNGYKFVHNKQMTPVEYVEALRDAGINHILLDNYTPDGDWSKVVKSVGDKHEILYLDKDKTPMFRTDRKFNIIILPPIVDVKISFVRNFVNFCGTAAPLDDSYNNRRCTKPFRELSIRHDGNVSICCDDFRGTYFIGNIQEYDSIVDLWNNERFQAARIMLYHGRRDFKPCKGCNAVTMRVGLLPDQKGKDKMPEITEDVEAFCEAIGMEGYMSKIIVKREWEK